MLSLEGQRQVRIGAGAAADIRLNSRAVRDIHLDITTDGGSVWLFAHAPVTVNGRAIHGWEPLTGAADVEVGDRRLRLQIAAAAGQTVAPRSASHWAGGSSEKVEDGTWHDGDTGLVVAGGSGATAGAEFQLFQQPEQLAAPPVAVRAAAPAARRNLHLAVSVIAAAALAIYVLELPIRELLRGQKAVARAVPAVSAAVDARGPDPAAPAAAPVAPSRPATLSPPVATGARRPTETAQRWAVEALVEQDLAAARRRYRRLVLEEGPQSPYATFLELIDRRLREQCARAATSPECALLEEDR